MNLASNRRGSDPSLCPTAGIKLLVQVPGFVTLPGRRGGCPGLCQSGCLVLFFWMEVDASLLVSFGAGVWVSVLKVPKPEEDGEVQRVVLKAGETAKSISAFSTWFPCSCS